MKRKFLQGMFCIMFMSVCCSNAIAQKKDKKNKTNTTAQAANGLADRKFWLSQMDKMVRPMMRSLAHDSLHINMPTAVSIHSDDPEGRRKAQYLEVLGRVLSGISPWLQCEGGDDSEKALRKQYREWALQ